MSRRATSYFTRIASLLICVTASSPGIAARAFTQALPTRCEHGADLRYFAKTSKREIGDSRGNGRVSQSPQRPDESLLIVRLFLRHLKLGRHFGHRTERQPSVSSFQNSARPIRSTRATASFCHLADAVLCVNDLACSKRPRHAICLGERVDFLKDTLRPA